MRMYVCITIMAQLILDVEPEYCDAEVCIIDQCEFEEVQWIECKECARWLHKYCSGLREEANPKHFLCDFH